MQRTSPSQAAALGFSTTLLVSGKTTTEIAVSEDIVTSLNAGKRSPARATINGRPHRAAIAPMGGRFMLSVGGDVRAPAGVETGDGLDVSLELDSEPRPVTAPSEFAGALANHPGAQAVFNTLAYFSEQRTAKAVAALREERA